MIHYKLVSWQFDTDAWRMAVNKAVEDVGHDVVAGVLGVHVATIYGWKRMESGYKEFPYPNMTNFIAFCNAMDLDPRKFFVLEDV
jgi:hypothetical protein